MVKMLTLSSNEEWLKVRKNYIGGSDCSAILGMNPFKTNIELWQEKCGLIETEDISEKPYIKYGHEAEPHLRELFALDHPQFKVDYAENNLWLNDKYPFAHASLDGELTEIETGRRGILEIKTSSILQSMQKEKWNEKIPDNYYLQVLHYLMVTEFDFVELKAQLKFDYGNNIQLLTKHYHIERQEVEEDISILMAAEKKFYKQILDRKKPALILPNI